jgi:small subunit ribosomal protein S2
MSDVSLQQLLEAGCHFGHKAERWHPRAKDYIYTEKDGIHIIDLVKTKAGLDKAYAFVEKVASDGGEVLFVGTKRQAKGIVREQAMRVGAPYFAERWIGGFLTNWEEIHKNIQKIHRLQQEQETGAWKRFPKHEQVKLGRYLAKLKFIYNGVLKVTALPKALFVIDIKKEIAAVREAVRMSIPLVAVCDTNVDPASINYPVPANDDAVGSIKLIIEQIAQAFENGRKTFAAAESSLEAKPQPTTTKAVNPPEMSKPKNLPAGAEKVTVPKARRGRPKKTEAK